MLSTSAFAATLKNPGEARQLTDAVMAKVAAGDAEGALRLTKPYLIIPDSEFETMVERLKLQAPLMAARFGTTIGTEFVREDAVGESLLRITQIQKFERHPMRWVFYFYKGKDGRVLNTFRTDDSTPAAVSMSANLSFYTDAHEALVRVARAPRVRRSKPSWTAG